MTGRPKIRFRTRPKITIRPTMVSEVRRAQEMREEGRSLREIAERLDRSWKWAKTNTAPPSPAAPNARTHPRLPMEARYMYQRGAEKPDIAKKLGVTLVQVIAWTDGVRRLPGYDRQARAMAAHLAGMAHGDIARKVGYKSGRVVAATLSQMRRRQKEEMTQ